MKILIYKKVKKYLPDTFVKEFALIGWKQDWLKSTDEIFQIPYILNLTRCYKGGIVKGQTYAFPSSENWKWIGTIVTLNRAVQVCDIVNDLSKFFNKKNIIVEEL